MIHAVDSCVGKGSKEVDIEFNKKLLCSFIIPILMDLVKIPRINMMVKKTDSKTLLPVLHVDDISRLLLSMQIRMRKDTTLGLFNRSSKFVVMRTLSLINSLIRVQMPQF